MWDYTKESIDGISSNRIKELFSNYRNKILWLRRKKNTLMFPHFYYSSIITIVIFLNIWLEYSFVVSIDNYKDVVGFLNSL